MNDRVEVHRPVGEPAMLALGADLARDLRGGQLVALSGDLGAGKTTLVRGMLRGLGFEGRVKSPSYGLVESYELADLTVHHLDLYRLGDPGELDFLGLGDLLADDSVVLVEWPERAGGRLPAVSRRIEIEHADEARTLRVVDLG
ncbi:tRNA (adenosine(37)-N6)-threonylcarbamoyltransferase complex ATPase subunit type 1 TsaE [Wenzhouxiangella sp. XN79A]|uniref:tRNA (adenosine(37)-N6)-threonylcarbamoyltransferase complex ATPase subunit type 1 TsaE n=1 Tax=Wenzhouxiangella sp. XN79A TaxID=2724193 RepID=UPI0032174DBA